MWSEIANGFQGLNGYLVAIAILSFFGIVVMIERIISLQFVYNLDFDRFVSNLKKLVAANDMDRAMTFCKAVKKTSLPLIALRAIEASEADPQTVRGNIDENTIAFLPALEARLSFLPAFATLILLIGVLGTIDSLWGAFHSIDILDTAKKQASLASGIAVSLNPTALGILFSMIILAGHQVLKGLSIRLSEKIYYGVTVLTNLLAPQEVVTAGAYMPSPAPEPVPEAAGDADEEDDDGDIDDTFDDASLEDIKDEEEII